MAYISKVGAAFTGIPIQTQRLYQLRNVISPPLIQQRRTISTIVASSYQKLRNMLPKMTVELEEEIDPGTVPGTTLRIEHYPSPILRAKNEEVTTFDMELKKLAKEMLTLMYASKGVGLAAPQVGVNKRLLVFNPEASSKAWLQEIVLVNPTILSKSKKTDLEMEACLSFPGMSGKVRRSQWVKVEAYRLNGKKFKVKYEGWKARIFQHEYDHLDGVLYIDRLDSEERAKVEPRLKELVAAYPSNEKAL